MAERKKLTTRTRKAAATEEGAAKDAPKEAPKHVERALKDVKDGTKPRRVPYDTHPDTHSKLTMMRARSRDNVPVKSFLDEAVEDLFEKYRRGEGRFVVSDIDRILGD